MTQFRLTNDDLPSRPGSQPNPLPAELGRNRCDKCQAKLNASPMLISGFTMLFCTPCCRFRLEGDDQWFDGGAGVVDRALHRAKMIEQMREKTNPE
jgi:hypothetical protein